LALSLVGLSFVAAPAVAEEDKTTGPVTLDRLLSGMAELPGLTVEFEEEKRITLLAVPVRSEGVIHFAPPGTLLRRVTAPEPSAALIEGERLSFMDNGERQEIDLEDNPVVAGFVDSFRHVLAGDREALERTYRVRFEASGKSWTLTLEPKDGALARFLERMVLEGSGERIERMKMVEASGDVTVTTFSSVRVHSFSARQKKRLLSL
jgi:outer membrane lipoprotein-sorting protein